MSSTGTYSFSPSAGDIVLNAFGMIQVRRWELTDQHLTDAAFQCQMQMVEFSNRNPNTWQREEQTISLVQGVPTYNLADRTLAIAIAYISSTNLNDTVLGPLSMNDYASLPDKTQEGRPTTYTLKLLNPTPTVSLWPAPDDNGPYELVLDTFRQSQDVQLAGGVGIDSPYRFLDAFTKGLAYRLSGYYPPKMVTRAELKIDAENAFSLAAQRDQESTNLYVRPDMSGYFR